MLTACVTRRFSLEAGRAWTGGDLGKTEREVGDFPWSWERAVSGFDPGKTERGVGDFPWSWERAESGFDERAHFASERSPAMA